MWIGKSVIIFIRDNISIHCSLRVIVVWLHRVFERPWVK
jgi:hypothetical protein